MNTIQDSFKKRVKKPLRDLWWRLYGNVIKNPALPKNPKSFLFICKGNICRSPFAEHFSRTLATQFHLHEAVFYSAGLEVNKPSPSPSEAITAAKGFDVTLNNHLSKMVTPELVQSSDMAITMEAPHLNTLRRLFPQLRDKFFLLPLFDKKGSTGYGGFLRYNITDPYGKDLKQYLLSYERIARSIKELFKNFKP